MCSSAGQVQSQESREVPPHCHIGPPSHPPYQHYMIPRTYKDWPQICLSHWWTTPIRAPIMSALQHLAILASLWFTSLAYLTVEILYCICSNAVDNRMFPDSVPVSWHAFTKPSIILWHLYSESTPAAPQRASCQWRDLQSRMQSGLGQQGGPSSDGAMAVFCPVCPQPGINLPEDWKTKYNQYGCSPLLFSIYCWPTHALIASILFAHSCYDKDLHGWFYLFLCVLILESLWLTPSSFYWPLASLFLWLMHSSLLWLRAVQYCALWPIVAVTPLFLWQLLFTLLYCSLRVFSQACWVACSPRLDFFIVPTVTT